MPRVFAIIDAETYALHSCQRSCLAAWNPSTLFTWARFGFNLQLLPPPPHCCCCCYCCIWWWEEDTGDVSVAFTCFMPPLNHTGIKYSLSVLTGIFQVNPRQPVFIEAKDDGGGGGNWSYKSCKAPVKSSPPTNQCPVFLQAGCPSCRPTNSVKALKGKISHSMDLLTPGSLVVF